MIASRPGIGSEFLKRQRISHVGKDEAFQRCQVKAAGLIIPYHTLNGEPVMDSGKPFARLRMDEPDGSKKYHQAAGTSVHAYVPVGLKDCDHGGDLIVVEGEFKALSLMDAGYPAVGVSGFYGYRYKVGDAEYRLVQELKKTIDHLKPDQILFVGDNDTSLNWQFSDAACSFRDLLKKSGYDIEVCLPRIPLDLPKGIDDCRADLGAEFNSWWQGRVTDALVLNKVYDRNELILDLLIPDAAHVPGLKGQARQWAEKRLVEIGGKLEESPVLWGKFLDLLVGIGISRSTLKKSLKEYKIRLRTSQAGTEEKPSDTLGDCPEYAKLIESEGEPYGVGAHGAVTINEPFFVRKFTIDHPIIFEPAEKRFYEYSEANGLWEYLTVDAIKDELSADLRDYAETQPEHEEKLNLKRTNALTNSLASSLHGRAEDPDAFRHDAQKAFIHLTNGVLDLRDPEHIDLKSFHPSWHSRNQIPYELSESAECPRFLHELLEPQLSADDIYLLQRYAGSILLGGNLTQNFLIFTGQAGSGKGTIVEVFEEIIGRKNVAELRTNLLFQQFELASFIGKTLLCGKDVPGNFLQHRSASVIKKLVGHDWLDAECKFSNERCAMRGEFALLINCNSRLHVHLDGDEDAWRRRMMILEFNNPPVCKKVPNFSLMLAKEEGAGIVAWMIQGAVEFLHDIQQYGEIRLTETQKERVNKLLQESDSVRHFVRRRLVANTGGGITTDELIAGYVTFCMENDWTAKSPSVAKNALPDIMLAELGVTQSHDILRNGKSKRGYRGVSKSTQ